MLKKIKLNFLILLVIFLFFIPKVGAINFGTVQKNRYAEVKQGETAEFIILFWNLDEPLPVKLKVRSVPENFSIIIRPEEFILNKSEIGPPYDESEYLNLGGMDVKVFPVKILVKPPLETNLGKYEVLVTVFAGTPTHGISILQEKTFKFTLNTTKIEKPPSTLLTTGIQDTINKLTGMVAAITKEGNVLWLFISTMAIIGIIWLIKRRF